MKLRTLLVYKPPQSVLSIILFFNPFLFSPSFFQLKLYSPFKFTICLHVNFQSIHNFFFLVQTFNFSRCSHHLRMLRISQKLFHQTTANKNKLNLKCFSLYIFFCYSNFFHFSLSNICENERRRRIVVRKHFLTCDSTIKLTMRIFVLSPWHILWQSFTYRVIFKWNCSPQWVEMDEKESTQVVWLFFWPFVNKLLLLLFMRVSVLHDSQNVTWGYQKFWIFGFSFVRWFWFHVPINIRQNHASKLPNLSILNGKKSSEKFCPITFEINRRPLVAPLLSMFRAQSFNPFTREVFDWWSAI